MFCLALFVLVAVGAQICDAQPAGNKALAETTQDPTVRLGKMYSQMMYQQPYGMMQMQQPYGMQGGYGMMQQPYYGMQGGYGMMQQPYYGMQGGYGMMQPGMIC